jgi:hypothetical protein
MVVSVVNLSRTPLSKKKKKPCHELTRDQTASSSPVVDHGVHCSDDGFGVIRKAKADDRAGGLVHREKNHWPSRHLLG